MGWVVAILVALLLPLSATVIYVSATLILKKETSGIENNDVAATYSRMLFAVIFFVVALQGLIVGSLVGAIPPVAGLARTPIVLFGLLGIFVGNLLPRTRPNLALGIRTPRTLSDRQIWQKTHRIAGYLAVFLGVLFVVGGTLLPPHGVEAILGPVSIGAAGLLAVEHLRRRT